MVIASSQHGTLRGNELSITDPGISPRDCFDLSILGSHSRSWSIRFLGRKTRVVGHFARRNLSSSFLQTNIFLFTVFYASVKSSARRNTKCHLLGNIMPPYLASSAPFLGLPLSLLAALLSSTDQFLQRPKVESGHQLVVTTKPFQINNQNIRVIRCRFRKSARRSIASLTWTKRKSGKSTFTVSWKTRSAYERIANSN